MPTPTDRGYDTVTGARRRRAAVAVTTACGLAACGSSKPTTTAAQRADAGPGPARLHAERCVPSPLRGDPAPTWARASGMPAGSRYLLAAGDRLVAYVFHGRFRAGPERSGVPRNKILWMPGVTDNGGSFSITGRSPHGGRVTASLSPSTSGGAIPSALVFSKPGCWRLVARWGSRQATVSVAVHA